MLPSIWEERRNGKKELMVKNDCRWPRGERREGKLCKWGRAIFLKKIVMGSKLSCEVRSVHQFQLFCGLDMYSLKEGTIAWILHLDYRCVGKFSNYK